jgi:hypothetical protein
MRLVDRTGRLLFSTFAECADCGRVFDLLDGEDADEFAHGHDCEEIDG